MHTHHDSSAYLNLAGQVAHTFRRPSMWTIPLVMSLVCVVWGLGSIFMGRFGGPDLISWSDAALMSGLGLVCFCYVLVGDYLRSKSKQSSR